MCGRFNLKTNITQVAKVFQAMDLDGDPPRPNYKRRAGRYASVRCLAERSSSPSADSPQS